MSILHTWLIIAVLIFVNAIFVLSEIAIIASKKSKLSTLKASGKNKDVNLVLKFQDAPETFLATIQVGITLLNIVIGMFTGRELTDDFVKYLGFLGLSEEYEHAVAYLITLLLITFLTVLGEIIPKRLALIYPEKLSIRIARLMLYASYLFYPLVKLLNVSTKLCLKLMPIDHSKKHIISIEEIKFLVNQANTEGTFATTESDIIQRIINLNDMQVRAVMIPRFDIETASVTDSIERVYKKVMRTNHSFLPVVDRDFKEINGIISTRKFLTANIKEKSKLKKSYVHFIFIPDLAKVTSLIEQMREKKAQVAIVVDEHGAVEGMITINDIFRIFINDLAHISEERQPAIKRVKDGYVVDGDISADEAIELMQLRSLSGDENEEYRTLAGFLLDRLGRIPKKGDSIELGNWKVVIMSMRNYRITKVKIIEK